MEDGSSVHSKHIVRRHGAQSSGRWLMHNEDPFFPQILTIRRHCTSLCIRASQAGGRDHRFQLIDQVSQRRGSKCGGRLLVTNEGTS